MSKVNNDKYTQIINSLQDINSKISINESTIIDIDIENGCILLSFKDYIPYNFFSILEKNIKLTKIEGFKKNELAVILDDSESIYYLYTELFRNFHITNLNIDDAVEYLSKYEMLCNDKYRQIEIDISINISNHFE